MKKILFYLMWFWSGNSLGQEVTRLYSEHNQVMKWDVDIRPTLNIISVTPVDALGIPPSVWVIKQYGERYKKGDFAYKDNDGNAKVSGKMSVIIDRYSSNLYWGDPDSSTGMNEFKCQVKNKKF